MTKEALKMALEALQNPWKAGPDGVADAIIAIKEALAQPERLAELGWQEIDCPICGGGARAFPKPEQEPMAWIERDMQCDDFDPDSVTCEKPTIAADGWEWVALYTTPPPQYKEPEQEWKLVPVEPTNEMLKAMDECSTEGYDERLYAGHAASVYMAAVNVAPTPPQPKDQKPVVLETVYETIIQWDEGGGKRSRRELARRIVSLYTTPPQRPWVGLTYKEVQEIHDTYHRRMGPQEFASMIEAKLREKNQ